MGKNPAQKSKEIEAKAAASKKVESRKTTAKKKKTTATAEAAPAKRSERKCKIASCKHTYRAKGYCDRHYKKWRDGAYGRARYKICKDTGCLKPMVMNRHGYCEDHFQSYYVKGLEVKKAAPAEAAPAKKEAVA